MDQPGKKKKILSDDTPHTRADTTKQLDFLG